MPADFFLVTDKIMLENPHIKRYGTSSKLRSPVFSIFLHFVKFIPS